MKTIEKLKQKILGSIKPSSEDESEIKKQTDSFLEKLNSEFRKMRIKAKAETGGSFAKGTTIKKKRYDVDIFAVFDKKYKSDEISAILEKVLKKLAKAEKLPGSRDYFSVNFETLGNKNVSGAQEINGFSGFRIEIVPVIKISSPKEAKNITDLSLMHVRYITNAIKNKKKLGDEIRLAKALCYANECYGAESHIKGFSGYSLEILTNYYGSFENLVKNAAKWKDKLVIDPKKYYKGKNALLELNEAKTLSPLVLIDPVQKDRNAAAALSEEKFNVFRQICKKFMKKPSESFFEKKKTDESKIIEKARKGKMEIYRASAESSKIKEDIAGSKLLKLFEMIKRNFESEGYKLAAEWEFSDKKAKMWFSVKKPEKNLRQGPFIEMKKHADEFRKKYKKAFVKKGRLFAYVQPKKPEIILQVGKKQLEDMGISRYKIEKL